MRISATCEAAAKPKRLIGVDMAAAEAGTETTAP
jgi:hypothetical protein